MHHGDGLFCRPKAMRGSVRDAVPATESSLPA